MTFPTEKERRAARRKRGWAKQVWRHRNNDGWHRRHDLPYWQRVVCSIDGGTFTCWAKLRDPVKTVGRIEGGALIVDIVSPDTNARLTWPLFETVATP